MARSGTTPRVWIDLANSPHVPLFLPVIARLRERGIEVQLTARDFAETRSLAGLHGLDATVIGRHGGRGSLGKLRAIAARALELRRFARSAAPDLAVSHNSYAQCIAAWLLGIPCLTIMDYEHTPANHVSFRLASTIVLPASIDPASVRRYGATPSRIVHYPGFKEQIYLTGFRADAESVASVIPADVRRAAVIAVARPPADFAIYHRFENPLFETWLRRAGCDPACRVVVLPRTEDQLARLEGLRLPSVVIPRAPLDGSNLVYHADLVVSAGGTMNREAAVLGIPAYSLFGGLPAAVDRDLASMNRMTLIREERDLERIRLVRKPAPRPLESTAPLERIVGCLLRELERLEQTLDVGGGEQHRRDPEGPERP